MEMDPELQGYSFHGTWNLKRNLVKPFAILMRQIDQHMEDETHETFLEEGLLFKSYLYWSGIGEKSNKDKKKATECLNELIARLDNWKTSPQKDGFLSIAYALEAWIDMDKTELRLQDLKKLNFNNRNETRKCFEATIHYIKGFSLSRLGVNYYEDCIDEFRQATEKCPENHEYLFSLAFMTLRFNDLEEVGEEVKEMLLEVLEKNNDYLYAKVELAKIDYFEKNTVGTTELLEEITTELEAKTSITPENMKILGQVIKLYAKMKEYGKAESAYTLAYRFGQEPNSSVLYQKAILAKKTGQWKDYTLYLQKALEKSPYNLRATLALAKQRLYRANIEEVNPVFDQMINDHEGDENAIVQILTYYGTMLWNKYDRKGAVVRYEKAMRGAFKFCQRNEGKKSQKIKFSYELNVSILICVKNLRSYWKSDIEIPEVICKLVDLEYKLRNVHLTRSYCNDALTMALDENRKSEIACILAKIEIELATEVDTLAKVDETLEMITPSEIASPKLEELRDNLAYRYGILHERLHHTLALKKYATAAKSGHVGAIQRLFSTLEIIHKTGSKFYETCALIDRSIMSIRVVTERNSMGERFKMVLETAISGDLKRLREQQFEMEKALLSKSAGPVYNPATVIQTSRNLLNYAMDKLTRRYRPPSIGTDKSIDFFCIHRNFDMEQTEEKVRKKLKDGKWENADGELIEFLVKIQPCTNPQANNWIMAFMEFNNTDKHQRQNKQYGKYKVYPEDQGAQPGVYQDKEYYSVDLARIVCNNIPYILDNLNGFSLIF